MFDMNVTGISGMVVAIHAKNQFTGFNSMVFGSTYFNIQVMCAAMRFICNLNIAKSIVFQIERKDSMPSFIVSDTNSLYKTNVSYLNTEDNK